MLKAKANRKQVKSSGVGSKIKYKVTLSYTNKTKGAAFDKAGVTVTLPAGVSTVKTAVSPHVKTVSQGSSCPAPVVSGSTVVFANAPLAGRKRRTYKVWAKVTSGAASPLVFQAALTDCALAANNVTVRAALWNRVLGMLFERAARLAD